MANGLSNLQLVSVIVNLSILLVSLVVCGILIVKIKFEDKNYRLLFILYTLYWISPMLLREYTSKAHTAMVGMDPTNVGLSSLMWLPVVVYGIISLFWKPLNDLMSHKLKSRKTVIYISLIIQAMGAIPMVIYPCLATNIIQSITVGIGASGIAVFNLMFNEQYAKKKVFLTVSLLSLPPLLAEFLSSVLQACVTSFLPSKPDGLKPTDPQMIAYWNEYLGILKYMWIVGLICIVITAILGIFVKEKRAYLYQDNQYKEPVSNKWDGWVLVLLILSAAVTSFIKFCTSGGTALSELEFIGEHQFGSASNPTKYFEGYLSVIFTVGQMAANIVTGLFLVKRFKKVTLFSWAAGIWIIYAILNAVCLNVYARMPLNILNGIAFGMTYNIIVGMSMNKYFAKTNKITPITLYNTGLSIGICSSQFFNTFLKQTLFDGGTITQERWSDFVWRNWIVTIAVVATMVAMWAMFFTACKITQKHPPKKVKFNKVKNWQDMDD